jgi:hypothetical protein
MQEKTPESRFLVSKHAVKITEIIIFPSNIFQEKEIFGAYSCDMSREVGGIDIDTIYSMI